MDTDEGRAAYDRVVDELMASGAQSAKMFGMPSLKLNGKAFAGYFKGEMVFKLRGPEHGQALSLPGAHLFDPMGGRPMKEWVQVPAGSTEEWLELGQAALRTVGHP